MKQLLIFILMATVMCWLMFAPVYKHVAIMQQALLQQEVDYLLEVGANASFGHIGEAAVLASRERLMQRGFVAEQVVYQISTTDGRSGVDPDQPVPRGTGIVLEIRYPYGQLFEIDRLIGLTPPAKDAMMGARGVKMSEYVQRGGLEGSGP